MLKRTAVTNITHYEYCFDNNLKNKIARELIKMHTELGILDLRGRNFTTSPLLRKSQNLIFLALEVQWASQFTVFV